MGGYVPPHLRGKGGGDAGGSSSASGPPPRSGSFNDLRSRDGGGGGGSRGGWGDDRGGGGGGGGGSFGARRPEPARGGGSRYPSGPVESVFAPYDPSDRVKGLTEEQVADIRQRLNVTVEVPEGEPAAAAPVESFRDMVRGAGAGPARRAGQRMQ
jgi:ATP-dependent RNA helicase DDX5/DBP2